MQQRNEGNIQGIDVSRYQGKIDWLQVKADKREFVFIKATEGQTYTDPKFAANVKGALSAGLLVGTYHFLRATSAEVAKAEAAHYAKSLEAVGGVKALQLPPVMDYENNPGGISKAQINIVAKAFLTELERLTGVKPIIYTGNSFAGNFDTGLSGYDLWIARYSNTKVPDDQPAWKTWDIWQYSDSGKVPGITGSVDLNEFNGSLADLKKRYGKEQDMSNPFDGYRITSPFGMRKHPVSGVNKFHRGVDLVVSPADGPIYAFVAGEVMHAKMGVSGSGFGNYGIVVAIKDDKGYLHVYAHLSAAGVKVGQQVKRGQLIGKQGSTGISSGAHLHYEVRKACTPQYGYTTTEAGVVEPTQYLINYYGLKPNKEDKPVTVRDINLVSAWAEASWKEAQANGYFDGSRPGAPITREESAIVINRLRRNFLALIAGVNGDVKDLDERLQKIEAEG
ncbi:GH25 family lysozyme [Paenibacillus xylanilyticus]|uniref:Peptidoglycan DD-metalloendopeptidase family protein n=1 Tax=Paenibacillus xylanilyticus TaxID=248903 RepID=A0A7Y6BSA1_9BACL|nr:GH25 family lysozyme [Paenibacillus xylanilyticus]NUU74040.1 peptidoglycan DD-metalloendopeptidase family protein [Paenibacillus xylanilyticus]